MSLKKKNWIKYGIKYLFEFLGNILSILSMAI